MKEKFNLVKEWDKTLKKSDKVNHEKVTFFNSYGITLEAFFRKNMNAEQ